jgi:hypothetical protein
MLMHLQRQGVFRLVSAGRMLFCQCQQHSALSRHSYHFEDWNSGTPWFSSYPLFERFVTCYCSFLLGEVTSSGLLTTEDTAVVMSSSTCSHCKFIGSLLLVTNNNYNTSGILFNLSTFQVIRSAISSRTHCLVAACNNRDALYCFCAHLLLSSTADNWQLSTSLSTAVIYCWPSQAQSVLVSGSVVTWDQIFVRLLCVWKWGDERRGWCFWVGATYVARWAEQ